METRLEDTPARRAYLNLVQASERLLGEFSDLFRAHGLTHAQFNVLRILVQGPEEGVSCQHIGEHLIHRLPDVTRLLDRMEAAGLVTRVRSAEDRRVVIVRITAEGRARCEALYGPAMELHARQFAHLPERRVRELASTLRTLFEPS